MTRHLVVVLALLGLGLPAIAHTQSARAQLKDAQAKVVGTATLSEVSGGVRVTLRVNGLKPIPTVPMRGISRTSKWELMERAPSTRSTRW